MSKFEKAMILEEQKHYKMKTHSVYVQGTIKVHIHKAANKRMQHAVGCL